MTSFAAQIGEWAAKVDGAAEDVVQISAQKAAEEIKTRMPRVTNYLRASLKASTSMMPPIDPKGQPEKGRLYDDNDDDVNLVIQGSELGQTIYLGITAAYGRRLNNGFVGTDSLGRTYNQPALGFVDLTAQRWPQIVQEAEAEAKARAGLT